MNAAAPTPRLAEQGTTEATPERGASEASAAKTAEPQPESAARTEVPSTSGGEQTPTRAPTRANDAAEEEDPALVEVRKKALDAAFEGRLAEASEHYSALAKGGNAREFALAARFLSEGAVRRP